MTPQEIFNKAYLGLKAQGQQSITDDIGCAYNGPDGTHCGIGLLVPPETGATWDTYSIFRRGIRDLIANGDPLVPAFLTNNAKLAAAIQSAHDSIVDWDPDFEDLFAEVAERFDLEVPV